jgi:hypothetical protein
LLEARRDGALGLDFIRNRQPKGKRIYTLAHPALLIPDGM